MPESVHLLSLSLDQNLLSSTQTDVLLRQQEYARHFDHTTILVLNHGSKYKPQQYNHLDIIPVNAWGQWDLMTRTFHQASRIFKSHPFQLITAQDPIAAGTVGLWLKQKFQVPLNIQVHADYFSSGWQKQKLIHYWYRRLINQSLAKADSVRVVSETLKNKVKTKARVFVAPIRVDLDIFWKSAHYRPKISKFISVCRLAPEKNLPVLIEAFSEVIKTHPHITLTIVGDGPERATLEQQASGLPITFTGHLSTTEVAKHLHHHDVFILPSLYEGWGMAYVEAFAAGLPVITTPVASVGELLQPNINSLIADTPSAAALMPHLINLINHPEEAYRLAKNGQMWVKNNLESTVLVNHWIRGLYKTLEDKS